jgi:asparagine synthase (glutamine-hydrolysing)
MSVQFGRWNFDGMPTTPIQLKEVRQILAPYGPDGSSSHSQDSVNILYYAFHTTRQSRREVQPYVLKSGTVITWDGRLDNRAEFIALLRDSLSQDSSDVSVVAAAYERWGTDCFAKLIGDWALSIWNPNECSVILAKDFLGTRHLYYLLDDEQFAWSTLLDPLILSSRKTFALEEEYIAGWLSSFPATHLTPYVGLRSVPPSSFIRIEKKRHTVTRYWDFNPDEKIRYWSDTEYEEHFRIVLEESVRRRLRSDSPVLAELSGGMDSSSIVCMADVLIARGPAEPPRLDTVSYYDDSEPNWNERPYFTKVEEKRGRTGCHIDVSTDSTLLCQSESHSFSATPGISGSSSKATRELATYIAAQGHRVVLSGTGGDEMTGGVPTPLPELEDILATAKLWALCRQLKIWALNKRMPLLHLLFKTLRGFAPVASVRIPSGEQPAPWLSAGFVGRHQNALSGYESRLRFFGPLPSFQENISTLDALRRQIACDPLRNDLVVDKCYPYLDRDLMQFLFAIPREQLVRPGQRRSLMRRALVGIVPEELLNRRRKAFAARSPATSIADQWTVLTDTSQNTLLASLGIVEPGLLFEAVQKARRGQELPVITLMRTLALERWLRTVSAHEKIVTNAKLTTPKSSSLGRQNAIQCSG